MRELLQVVVPLLLAFRITGYRLPGSSAWIMKVSTLVTPARHPIPTPSTRADGFGGSARQRLAGSAWVKEVP